LKFSELQLEPTLIQAIEKLGYTEMTPVQELTMPHVLEGRDVSGLAQTGTGKTAAFLIPLMDRILKARTSPASPAASAEDNKRRFQDWKAQNFNLILVPTRELAEQVYENIVKFSEFSGLRGVSVYGGTSYDKQKEGFRNQVEFVVATPGRLIDLYKENVVDLKQVRAIVFDEADRMFDMGFKDDMKYILQRVPRDRQFLVFSATLNFDVLNTAYQFGAEPIEINVSKDQAKAENVKDEILHVGHEEKPQYLLSLIKKHNPRQLIIFSNFKLNVEKIANFLNSNNVPAMAISSLLTQAQRNRVIEQFKADNEKNILVATDVAARGLDIKGVDMVINYELPNDAESYVHRIGRTGRAGAEGLAFSLVCDRDVESLKRVEDYLKHKLSVGWIEDQELVKEMTPFPREAFFDRNGGHFDRPHRQEQREGRGGREGGHREKRHHGGGDRGRHQGSGQHKGHESRDQRDQRGRRDHRDQRPQNPRHPNQKSGPHQSQPRHHEHKQKHPHQQSAHGKHQQTPRGQFKKHPHKHPQRRPLPHHGKQAQKPSLVQKVSGFLKKLFD